MAALGAGHKMAALGPQHKMVALGHWHSRCWALVAAQNWTQPERLCQCRPASRDRWSRAWHIPLLRALVTSGLI